MLYKWISKLGNNFLRFFYIYAMGLEILALFSLIKQTEKMYFTLKAVKIESSPLSKFQTLPACDLIDLTSLIGSIHVESV